MKAFGGFARVALVGVIVTSLFLRCVLASANQNHSVGGSDGWDLTSNLQEWADKAEFHVGDSLVFSYTPLHDVLEVNATDYSMCHTVNPVQTYNDGETVIPLSEEGDRYFICGRVGHCAMGLKLHVHVLPELLVTNATSPTPSTGSIPATGSFASPPSPIRSPLAAANDGLVSPPPPEHTRSSSSGHGVETTSVQTVAAVLGFFMCLPCQIVRFLFPVLLIIISIGGYAAAAT